MATPDIRVDPLQVEIPNDQNIGEAQVLKSPDLSYLDKMAEINARNKAHQADKMAQRQHQLANEIDVNNKGKIWSHDSPYLASKQQGLIDWLNTDNNATKILKQNDLGSQLEFNKRKQDLLWNVNQSINKNSQLMKLQDEIDKTPGGINDYHQGAAEELQRHMTELTPDQIANGETPTTVDATKFQKRLAPGATLQQVKSLAGPPQTVVNEVPNPDGSTSKRTDVFYSPEQIKTATAATLNMYPTLFHEESLNLKEKWSELSKEDKQKYTLPDGKGPDVMKYVEDQHVKALAREIKAENTYKRPQKDFTSVGEGMKVINGTTFTNFVDPNTGNAIVTANNPKLKGRIFSPSTAYTEDGQKVDEPVKIDLGENIVFTKKAGSKTGFSATALGTRAVTWTNPKTGKDEIINEPGKFKFDMSAEDAYSLKGQLGATPEEINNKMSTNEMTNVNKPTTAVVKNTKTTSSAAPATTKKGATMMTREGKAVFNGTKWELAK